MEMLRQNEALKCATSGLWKRSSVMGDDREYPLPSNQNFAAVPLGGWVALSWPVVKPIPSVNGSPFQEALYDIRAECAFECPDTVHGQSRQAANDALLPRVPALPGFFAGIGQLVIVARLRESFKEQGGLR
ncbi:hypothetical protein LCM4573_16760 [Rhizobium sp. LCM 4573]|nr:hypothetical protein LCM4573_16760 [Rhizobium sp. LCM 4573]